MSLECVSYDLSAETKRFLADPQLSDEEKYEAIDGLKRWLDERVDLLGCKIGRRN